MLSGKKKIHMIGIGGVGMSGIAQLLLSLGFEVYGSDIKPSSAITALADMGAKVFIGHNSHNLTNPDLVVYSSCISDLNPEMLKARQAGIPVVARTDILAELMKDRVGITVSGSHGKTTTTSMIAHLLLEAGLSPTVAVGGSIINYNQNARLGSGKFFVVETDESDGSFLKLNPAYSIITNVDKEHLDYYKDFESLLKAFGRFFDNTKDGGCVFYCGDDKNLKTMASRHKGKKISYGKDSNSDIYPLNVKMNILQSSYECMYEGKALGAFGLRIPGMHNIINSLSVVGVGLELDIDIDVIKRSLATYKGAARRFHIKFNEGGIMVVDDYGHHPTEINATLEACKGVGPDRIVCVFQPHRYTRTKLLKEEFSKCFGNADYLIITDIYSASEEPIEGVSSHIICNGVKKHDSGKQLLYLKKDEINKHLMNIVKKGDLVLFLGAGDITRLSDEFSEQLKSKKQNRK